MLTVAEHMDDWLERVVKPTVRSSTYASYESLARVHIVPRVGRVKLADLNPAHVRGLLLDVIHSGRSEGTAGRVKACLSAALRIAMHDYGLVRNVAALVPVPKTGAPKFKGEMITVEQAHAVLDAFDKSRLGPLVRFAVATGLRQSEMLALHWEDIDLAAGQVHVHHALQRKRMAGQVRTLSRTKTERSRRSLPLNEMARDALAARKRQAAADQLAAGDTWKDEGWVFANPTGGSRDGTSITRSYKAILVSHGIAPIRWHALRRVFAALAQEGGVDLLVVRDLLGHQDLRTTQGYTYAMPHQAPDAMNAIDRVMRRPTDGGTDRGEAAEPGAETA
jgi:integrase